ncbi:DNA-binding transcriptional ArsR family regulator [Rhodococcus sp. LBL1]|nr:DNA-binding transcriptional ArsR family regulator [Rhodococcus sp. LBL1]MDH6684423.1 DNA-binding transcriptional ArsR family regulator [Rhodococcus sp. LBL2]
MVAVDALSQTFGALADPTRRAILARLAGGSASVGEIAEPFDMTYAAVSKHLRALEAAGLVIRRRDGQHRPATLDARPLAAASGWIEHYRLFWTGGLDALGAFLLTITSDETADDSQESDTVALPGRNEGDTA